MIMAKDLKKMVRRAIAYHVKEDLDGGELLMKEVYEQMETDADHAAAKAELRRILKWLEAD